MPDEVLDVSTPALVMGGQQNTLSIVRSLGSAGVRVSVSSGHGCWAPHSRYCAESFPYSSDTLSSVFWTKLLLSEQKPLKGTMLLTCNDDAIQFVAKNNEALRAHYIVDENIPELQYAMLDKQKTLELAQEAGCPIPQYWSVSSLADVSFKDCVTFPVMIKPIHSHIFRHYYPGKKYLVANDYQELIATIADTLEKEMEVMVCEMIPGPDTLLSSYYTYIDNQDNALFHFTKKVIRRYPVNSGGGTYHITEWDDDTAEMGERFFRGINFRGLGNIEFKRDLRDGKLKVIECNARFTAAQELLVQSGMDISLMVYRRLSGQSVPKFKGYRDHIRLLEPVNDFRSYRQLRARGEITFGGWVVSLLHKQTFSYFRMDDLSPFVAMLSSAMNNHISNLGFNLFRRSSKT
jgi:predicted ATP-grasp superfamily ATP-dependent carboligase